MMTDSTPNAVIYYVINGGTPVKYTVPVTVSASETILSVAVVPGTGGNPYLVSSTVTNAYVIQETAASTPTPTTGSQ